MTRRVRNVRRPTIVLRDIVPPAVLASDLFRQVYLPIVQGWSSGAERIIAEYERTLSQLTTDSPADVEQELNEISAALSMLVPVLTPQLRRWAFRTEAWFRGRWRGAVLSATGVDLQTIIGPEAARETLETIIAWNTSLIRDVNDQARQRIGNAVFDGLRNRTPVREVAKAIREAVAMSRRRSVGIASDQLSKLTSALADERRREAGLPDWEWIHSQKKHPREDHVARNGYYYTDDPARVGETVSGKKLMAPPQDRPGQLPYCGCRSRSVISFD